MVYCYVAMGTVCKSTANDSTLKIEVIYLRRTMLSDTQYSQPLKTNVLSKLHRRPGFTATLDSIIVLK